MSRFRLALLVVLASAFATAAFAVVPRGIEAQSWLFAQDDPAALADRALADTFNATIAAKDIETALAAGDVDLANSFLELAKERGVPLDPGLEQRVADANSPTSTAKHAAASFARGFIVGEPNDLAALAGTAIGDLFVFGDVRDAAREGISLALGEPADQLVLGLACVGIVITAGTYATLGVGTPARVGLSIVKAARKTGRIGGSMAGWIGRSLRDVVDLAVLRRAFATASITEPALAIRTAREAVKVERAGGLMHLVEDVGRVQTKAGTQAALDGLKLAEGPEEMARVAKLAEKKGGKTRAILRLLGRGAIALTVGAFDLALWVLGAAFTLFGFVSAAKGAVERGTWHRIQRSKAKRARRALVRRQRLVVAAAQG
ncbi:MAG: hypothetical protein ACLPKB_08410 [Xanthobacteraceae bacterium]